MKRDKVPKEQAAPKNTLHLLWLMITGMIKSIPKILISSVIMAVLSFVAIYYLNIYAIAAINDGYLKLSIGPDNPWYYLLNFNYGDHFNQAAFNALCMFFFGILSALITRIFSRGIKLFFIEMIGTPGYVIKCLRESKKRAAGAFFFTLAVVMLFSLFKNYSRNIYLMFTWAFGFLMSFTLQYQTIPHLFLTYLWQDFQNIFRKNKEKSELDSHSVSMCLLAFFFGFLILGLIRRQPLIPILLGVVFIVIGFLITSNKVKPKAAINMFVFLLTFVVVYVLYDQKAFAHDGGKGEAGGTWEAWKNSSGSDAVKQAGVKPGLLGSLGSFLGGMLTGGANLVSKAAGSVWSGTKKVAGAVADGVTYVGDKVADGAAYVGGKIADGAAYVGEKVVDGVSYVSEKVVDGVSYVGEKVVDGVSYVGEKIADGASYVGETISYTGEILSQTWENIKQDFSEAGQQISDFAGKAWEATKSLAQDIYNNPGKYWEGLKEGVDKLWQETKSLASDLYNHPEIIWDTLKGTAGTVANIGKSIAQGIYTTITDPKKAWEAIKDMVGYNNFANSWDPNRGLLDRLGQVGVGVFKLGSTLLGGKAAITAGKEVLKTGVKQTIVNIGTAAKTKVGSVLAGAKTKMGNTLNTVKTMIKDAKQGINNIKRTFTKLDGKGMTYVSKGAGNTKWMPKQTVDAMQKVSKEKGVNIIARYGNPESKALIEGGHAHAKPMFLKNKTINNMDMKFLGANKDAAGQVGHFKPKLNIAEYKKLNPAEQKKVMDRYIDRVKEYQQNDKKLRGMKDVKIENGVVKKASTGKPYAGDVDILDIRDAKTGLPVSHAKHDEVIKSLQQNGASVEHGAVTEWSSRGDFNKKAYDSMIDAVREGGKDGGALSFGPGTDPTHVVLTGP